jgi:hypothetical protein
VNVALLNPDQERRLDSHLSLLAADIDALEAGPGLSMTGALASEVRDALAATRTAVERLRRAFYLPAASPPSFKSRLTAFAAVWAARVDELHAARLRSYGVVHPMLTAQLDVRIDHLRRSLERVADAAAALP